MKEAIDWKRAKRDETCLSKRRIFDSRCGRYRVIEAVGKFNEMGTTIYAIFMPYTILSKHRSKNAAINACDKHLNPPKKRKSRKKKKK